MATASQADKDWIVEERGDYRFPPGLKRNVPL